MYLNVAPAPVSVFLPWGKSLGLTIAPSTIAQTACYTWLCAIYLLTLAFRNTFLMFHLLNSKLVLSLGAPADTRVPCFSLDAKMMRLRWVYASDRNC